MANQSAAKAKTKTAEPLKNRIPLARVRGTNLWRAFVEGGNEAADEYGHRALAAYVLLGARLADLGLVQLAPVPCACGCDASMHRWELTAAGVLAVAEERARLFRVEDGSGQHTATMLELWQANALDRGFLRWLLAAQVGESDGGFNSLRVERIR